MTTFTDDERAYLTEMRAFTRDANGQELLVGLSADETDFYINHSRLALVGGNAPNDVDRYLELHDKHEAARLSIIAGEAELRRDNPSRQ